MEKNDATIPWAALIFAAIFWVILLVLFGGKIKHEEEAKAKATIMANASAAKPDWKTNGQALFTTDCQGCHGDAGQGGIGKKLVGSELVLGKPEDLVHILEKGKGLMPAFGGKLTPTQILEVTNFVRNSWGNKGGEFGQEVFASADKGAEEKAIKNRSRFVPPDLQLPEIFLTTFVIVLLTYGLIGLYSVWAEGETLVPGIHKVKSTGLAMWGMMFCLGMVVLCSVLFVRQILEGVSLQGLTAEAPVINVTGEGAAAAGVILFLAAALMLYKKFFMDGEVLVEDTSGEFPW
jgi:mono/diheme cytochrome c family protein